jgi:glycosyltransferase involved in cell wall biosynthesis
MIARLLSRSTGLPWVFHVHSPANRDSTRSVRNRINSLVERLSLKDVTRLITVSESLARHMIRSGHDADRVVVVPNGVPTLKGLPDRARPKSPWRLGTMALFRPRKGVEVLLEAMSTLQRRRTQVILRAVGPFESLPYERHLKKTTEKLGLAKLVHWRGFRQDINAELQAMDLFVLPSLFGEGLPMVVLEAMAAGLPIVATDVEGIPEAVRDGLEGVIARAGDAQSLADAIESVTRGDHSWLTLRQNAVDRQAEFFSDRSMARGVADVYDDILAETAAGDRSMNKIAVMDAPA